MAERIVRESTPEEAARIDALDRQFKAEAPSLVERLRRLDLAENESGFCGEFRRAIRESMLGSRRISERANVDLGRLEAFLVGDGDLAISEVEAIAHVVGFGVALKAS